MKKIFYLLMFGTGIIKPAVGLLGKTRALANEATENAAAKGNAAVVSTTDIPRPPQSKLKELLEAAKSLNPGDPDSVKEFTARVKNSDLSPEEKSVLVIDINDLSNKPKDAAKNWFERIVEKIINKLKDISINRSINRSKKKFDKLKEGIEEDIYATVSGQNKTPDVENAKRQQYFEQMNSKFEKLEKIYNDMKSLNPTSQELKDKLKGFELERDILYAKIVNRELQKDIFFAEMKGEEFNLKSFEFNKKLKTLKKLSDKFPENEVLKAQLTEFQNKIIKYKMPKRPDQVLEKNYEHLESINREAKELNSQISELKSLGIDEKLITKLKFEVDIAHIGANLKLYSSLRTGKDKLLKETKELINNAKNFNEKSTEQLNNEISRWNGFDKASKTGFSGIGKGPHEPIGRRNNPDEETGTSPIHDGFYLLKRRFSKQ